MTQYDIIFGRGFSVFKLKPETLTAILTKWAPQQDILIIKSIQVFQGKHSTSSKMNNIF